MTWQLAYVSCNIPAKCWENDHQMTFPSKNFLYIYVNHVISAVIHMNVSLQTNTQTSLDRHSANHGTTGIMSNLQRSTAGCILSRMCKLKVIHSLVTSSLIYIPQDFHFSLSSSSPYPQYQVMARQTPQPGVIQSELSQTTSSSYTAPLAETELQRRHQLVHRDASIAATENMARDPHSKK
jgi:hypothetical protein